MGPNRRAQDRERAAAEAAAKQAAALADKLFEEKLFGEDKKADAIIAKAIAKAEEGDTTCIRLCLDRRLPVRTGRSFSHYRK